MGRRIPSIREAWDASVSRHVRHKNELYLAEAIARNPRFPMACAPLCAIADTARMSIDEAKRALLGLEADRKSVV